MNYEIKITRTESRSLIELTNEKEGFRITALCSLQDIDDMNVWCVYDHYGNRIINSASRLPFMSVHRHVAETEAIADLYGSGRHTYSGD